MEEASMRGLAGPEAAFPDMGGILAKAREIEMSVLLLAQVFPAGAPEFNQALDILKHGIAKGVAATGEAPGGSPEDVGAQFPGGGFTAGMAAGPK
jgi:hypothetical protein